MNKTEKLLDSSRKKRENTEINKNENGLITTENTGIQKIIRDYYEEVYSGQWTTLKKWINS